MIPQASSPISARATAALANLQAFSPSQKHAAAESPAGRKLRQAAAEFEGMLLSNLWKSMKSTFAESDDDSDDPAQETLNDMGIQAMSQAVGKAGGLGLGKLIIKNLEPALLNSQSALGAKMPPSIGKASALPADTFLDSRQP